MAFVHLLCSNDPYHIISFPFVFCAICFVCLSRMMWCVVMLCCLTAEGRDDPLSGDHIKVKSMGGLGGKSLHTSISAWLLRTYYLSTSILSLLSHHYYFALLTLPHRPHRPYHSLSSLLLPYSFNYPSHCLRLCCPVLSVTWIDLPWLGLTSLVVGSGRGNEVDDHEGGGMTGGGLGDIPNNFI